MPRAKKVINETPAEQHPDVGEFTLVCGCVYHTSADFTSRCVKSCGDCVVMGQEEE